MKIGIYFGSFNPVHISHINTIKYVLNNYVNKVIILPAKGNYWNKTNLDNNYKDRINMLKLIKDNDIIIDEVNNQYDYSYESLRKIKEQYPNNEIYIIFGMDILVDLDKWKNYQEIINYKFIIFPRNNLDCKYYLNKLNKIKDYIIVDKNQETSVSSTMIRNYLYNSEFKEASKYLDNKVFEYILNNNLYQEKININKLSKEVVNILIKKNITLSLMESCTGGYLAHLISNVKRSSNIFWGSAVTYNINYKYKMGVDKKIIDKYSVYSTECAKEMAINMSNYSNTDISIGVTGIINSKDAEEKINNKVYICIYLKKYNKTYEYEIYFPNIKRKKCKELLAQKIFKELKEIGNNYV